jgi:hypothetical protein
MIDACVELLTLKEIMVFSTKKINKKGHILHVYQLDQLLILDKSISACPI